MVPERLTVVIATYRRPEKLARLLAALVPQVEGRSGRAIAVVSDASHDAAYEAALAPFRGKIDYRVRERNGGPGAARNTGAESVASGFLVFTDDDCVPPPHWLDRLAALIAENPDVGVVGGYARPLRRARPSFVERFRMYWRRFPCPVLWTDRVYCLATLNLAVRADLFHRAGGFDERFVQSGEDLNLTYRLKRERPPFIVDEQWYVEHDLADSVVGIVRRNCRYAHGMGTHERLTGDYGVKPPGWREALRRAALPLRERGPKAAPARGLEPPKAGRVERLLFALLEATIAFAWTRAEARGFREARAGVNPAEGVPAAAPVAPAASVAPLASSSAPPRVTIVLTQREYFSLTALTLETLFRNTGAPFRLVAVDAGSPPAIRDRLRREAAARGFEVVRVEHFLAPQAARRLGLARVATPFTVFLENDTLVEPGWLEALLDCADATGADAVGPVYCQARRIGRHVVAGYSSAREPAGGRIVHMAGGEAHFDTLGGRRAFVERHYFTEQPLDGVRPLLRRERTEMIEFHCALVRTEALRRNDLLDERMPNGATHIDFCLALRAAGGAIWIEPRAIAVNVPPERFAWTDLRLYLAQWDPAANRASLARFREKWGLAEDDPFLRDHLVFLTDHRVVMLMPLTDRLRRVVGRSAAAALERLADRGLRRILRVRATA